MARVLVTGGAGYIGSHTVRALQDAGHTPIVFDDLSAGHRQAVSSEVALVEGRTHDEAALFDLLTRERIEAVMHFAAWLSVGDSVRDPVGYYENNVTGTLALLSSMARAGVQKFIFSSTAATYGEPERMPIDESFPTLPINAYGQTKLAIEQALPHYARAYGLRWIALRYFNASGAHPDGHIGEDHAPEIHLVPRAIQAASGGEPLKVFGDDYPTPDGTCLRDFIHVSDLASAHVRGLEALASGTGAGAYNVATGEPHSVREVIDTVSRVVGHPVQWDIAPRRAGDPASLYASSARLQQELGWRPLRASLATIVEDAWRWHQSHPQGYNSP